MTRPVIKRVNGVWMCSDSWLDGEGDSPVSAYKAYIFLYLLHPNLRDFMPRRRSFT
jgi:hypothetical protein